VSGDARHGRRDNGLVAAAYSAVGDVDPRVGEHLLDVLALEGIAAYLRPSSDLHPMTRSTTLPRRPTDRLYVDREHVSTAREHLSRLAREEREDTGTGDTGGESGSGGRLEWAEPTNDEVDRVFAEIVAGFGPGGSAGPRDDDRPEQRRRRARVEPAPDPEPEPTLLDGLDSFGAQLPDDESERFVPPEPPPIPRPSLSTVLAVVGVIGGLALFLKPDLLPFLSHGMAMFFGFAAVVGGFGTLVWRLHPGGDDDDTDPDDGARV
jgi:hypothetical protein